MQFERQEDQFKKTTYIPKDLGVNVFDFLKVRYSK